MTTRFLSLFSGIEAATCAWSSLGWECAAVAEIEPFPCELLAHHYPSVPNLGDITKITADQIKALGPIDLVCGGFPCQDLSVAGKRKGLTNADGTSTRSGLFFDAMRVADWAKPRWLFIENVPGMFSSNAGRDFADVVGEMAGCRFSVPRDGWRNAGVVVGPRGLVEWSVMDAQYHGLAQRRKRVFIVRDAGDWANRPPIFLESYRLQGNPAPRREPGERATGTLSARTSGGGGLGTDFELGGGLIPETVGTLCADSHPGSYTGKDAYTGRLIPTATHTLRGEGFDASEDGTGRGAPLVPVRAVALRGREGGATAELGDDQAFALRASTGGGDKAHVLAFDSTQITSKANRSNPQPGDPCHTLAKGAHAPTIAFDCKASGQSGFGVGEIASTMRAMGHANTHQNGGGHQAVLSSMQVRRLTPRECERLQGFPDDYSLIQRRGKPAADGPRYKALGNSWAVPVVQWIGQRIDAVNAIPKSMKAAA